MSQTLCPVCGGSGEVAVLDGERSELRTCSSCLGSGWGLFHTKLLNHHSDRGLKAAVEAIKKMEKERLPRPKK